MNSCIYHCRVMHQRHAPRAYGFTSSIFMFYLDLDELPQIVKQLRLVSHNRFNAYAFHDDDHLYSGHRDIRQNLEAYLLENGIDTPVKRICLLTNLRTFGHVFNPVSFYFCFDAQEKPLAVVAEVHNTYGEQKPFLLGRGEWNGQHFSDRQEKDFYISPFSDLQTELGFKLRLPDERLALAISEYQNGELFFHSALTGTRKPLTDGQLLLDSLRFPWVTLKVITLIHWHALRLYLKKLPVTSKRATAHLQKGVRPKFGQSTHT